MAGIDRTLQRYKQIKSESYRASDPLEDRLALLTHSVNELQATSLRQSEEIRQLKASKNTDFDIRLAKLEKNASNPEESRNFDDFRRRIDDLELQFLNFDPNRHQNLAFELDSALKNSEKALLVTHK